MNQYQGQSSCIILSISQEAQRAAVLAGQPAAAVQTYSLVERGDIAKALALGGTVEPDGVVVLRWGVTDPKPPHAAERTCILGQPWLDPRPTDTADALRLIKAAILLTRQATILNRWPPQPLTDDERAVLTAEQAAEVDGQVAEQARRKVIQEAEEATKAAAIMVARQAAEQAVAAFEVGGPEPDEARYLYHEVQTTEFDQRVVRERERRRIRRLAHLLGELGGADARFYEHHDKDTPLGLVSEEEALALVTNWVLPTQVVGPYEPILRRAFGHEDDCEVAKVGFVAHEVKDLTAEEYRLCDWTVQKLRSTLPLIPVGHLLRASQQSWPALVRRHVGECSTCGATESRLGIKVEVDLGDGVVVSREFCVLPG